MPTTSQTLFIHTQLRSNVASQNNKLFLPLSLTLSSPAPPRYRWRWPWARPSGTLPPTWASCCGTPATAWSRRWAARTCGQAVRTAPRSYSSSPTWFSSSEEGRLRKQQQTDDRMTSAESSFGETPTQSTIRYKKPYSEKDILCIASEIFAVRCFEQNVPNEMKGLYDIWKCSRSTVWMCFVSDSV